MTHQATIAAALREFCGCTEPAANDYAAAILDRLNLPDWHDRPTGPGLWCWLDSDGFVYGATATEETMQRGNWYQPRRYYGPFPLDTEGAK